MTVPANPINSFGPTSPRTDPTITYKKIHSCNSTPAAPTTKLPKRPWPHFQEGRRGRSQEGQREGQELDNRMCFHHVKSEPRTQTFTLHSRPSRYVSRTTQNCSRAGRPTSPKRRFCPSISLHFLCAHGSSYVHVSFCSYLSSYDIHNVILCNMRIRTFLTTQLDEVCAHP